MQEKDIFMLTIKIITHLQKLKFMLRLKSQKKRLIKRITDIKTIKNISLTLFIVIVYMSCDNLNVPNKKNIIDQCWGIIEEDGYELIPVRRIFIFKENDIFSLYYYMNDSIPCKATSIYPHDVKGEPTWNITDSTLTISNCLFNIEKYSKDSLFLKAPIGKDSYTLVRMNCNCK